MLALDTEKIERRKRIARFDEQQARNRAVLDDAIRREEATVARDGEIATTDLESQIGTPLTAREFERRLKLMNPGLMVEPSLADRTKSGIYIVRNRRKVFVCGMERAFMPERSVRHSTLKKMPSRDPLNKGEWIETETFVKETRGWRTVLMRLLRARLITQPQIDRMFPPNLNSRNWKILTT